MLWVSCADCRQQSRGVAGNQDPGKLVCWLRVEDKTAANMVAEQACEHDFDVQRFDTWVIQPFFAGQSPSSTLNMVNWTSWLSSYTRTGQTDEHAGRNT